MDGGLASIYKSFWMLVSHETYPKKPPYPPYPPFMYLGGMGLRNPFFGDGWHVRPPPPPPETWRGTGWAGSTDRPPGGGFV